MIPANKDKYDVIVYSNKISILDYLFSGDRLDPVKESEWGGVAVINNTNTAFDVTVAIGPNQSAITQLLIFRKAGFELYEQELKQNPNFTLYYE